MCNKNTNITKSVGLIPNSLIYENSFTICLEYFMPCDFEEILKAPWCGICAFLS